MEALSFVVVLMVASIPMAMEIVTTTTLALGSMECMEQLDYLPFDPVIKRTEGTVKDKSKKINGGATFKTSKGAPQVLLKLVEEAGGCDATTKKAIEKDVTELGKRGIRAIAVAKTDEQGVWRMMGLLTFLDPPRPDTKQTV